MKSVNIEWKTIYLDGKSSNYEISNDGNIRNNETEKLLHPSIRNGYLNITLYNGDRAFNISIHRLVATYFCPNADPIKNTVVDHIDGDKLNNWYGNLEWVTAKENKARAIVLGLDNPHHGHQPKGSMSGVSTHTEKDAHAACKLLEQGLSNKEIADKLGLDTEFIRSLKRGVWKHVTCNYNIPKPEARLYYSDNTRALIRTMIDLNIADTTIAKEIGLPDPTSYGKKYVAKIRSRSNQAKSSTTIPLDILTFVRH